MSTLTVVDTDDSGETKSQAVTRRIREELGRVGLSVSAVARLLGEPQPKLSRRMTGDVPWDVNTLGEFCTAAGISYDYVTTGIRELPDPPHPTERGQQRSLGRVTLRSVPTGDYAADVDEDAMAYLQLAEGLPRVDSNHQPFGQRSAVLVPVERRSYGHGRARMDVVISSLKVAS
jgi:hypothetical protein